MMKKLVKWFGLPREKMSVFAKISLLAPVAVWFSYWPQISLGKSDTTNFKLTFTMIYVVILAIFAVVEIAKNFAKFSEIFMRKSSSKIAVWLTFAFVFWNGISVFWSENRARTLLTFGIIFCLWLIFLVLILQKNFAKKMIKPLTKIFILTAVIMSIFALAQFFTGIWLTRNETLLCAGCVAGQFGFPRPNVFTIEPQFLGNLLLAPILILMWQIFAKMNKKIWKSFRENWELFVAEFLLILTLFLTLSRGAIFAFFAGFFVLILTQFFAKNSDKIRETRTIFASIILVFVSFIFAVCLQGFAAQISPTTPENFVKAAESSINQLSLGAIKFSDNKMPQTHAEIQQNVAQKKPAYTGYVAESTNVRTSLTRTAFDAWKAGNIREKLTGFGLGSSGIAMANFAKNDDPKEIVQNEFVEVLLELGVVGFVIFAAILVGLVREIWRNKNARWTLAIVAAFLVQWLFFSGYPSALHVYLIFAMIYVFAKKNAPGRIRGS